MTAISTGGRMRAYWELGKPRLSALAVFAVVAGGVVTVLIAASGFRVFPDLKKLKTVGG
jgi:heme O synthase-like polyprenyltransferase